MLYCFYQNALAKKMIIYSILPFLIFSFINVFYSKYNFSNYPLLYEFLAFIIFLIYFFYEKMRLTFNYLLYQSISFWICVGLFFYFCGNFFFLLFTSYSSNHNFIFQLQLVYTFVTIIKNLILSFSLLSKEINNNEQKSYPFPQDLDLDAITPNNKIT
jgi:hypothetical protein